MDKKRFWAALITFILGAISGILVKIYTGTFWDKYLIIPLIFFIATGVLWPGEEKEEKFKSEAREDFEVD